MQSRTNNTGYFVAVDGPNGSGKTTLMNIMYAYYTNDAKELRKYKYQEILY